MHKYFFYLLILFVLSSCLKDEPFNRTFEGYVPQSVGDDWQVSTPEAENMDRSTLDAVYQLVYQDDRYLMARSLLVFRNGKLVAEAYPNDPNDIHKYANIQSCTKSVTSIITGIAIQDNHLSSLDEKLYDIYPEYFDSDVNKRTITIEDALTMRTGLKFDNNKHTLELFQTDGNSIEYILSQERLYPSGTIMNYNDGASHLISKVIEKKTGQLMANYGQEKLFAPLNITDWMWEASKDNTTYGGFSLYLKPRDFGKVGQLLLQGGEWNNQQIIDSTYLTEATQTKVSANFNNEPYGYYFWALPSVNGYCALGHGGQFLLVVPEKNLVVVYTAWPYTSEHFFDERSELMSLIINSCN
jgi:CubicO group peptidase (beta-lactamase class C family)